jgi:phosphatidate cytidylyltransferase
MLLQRVITALALLPPVLATLWYGSTPLVGAVFGALALIGVYEWAVLTLSRDRTELRLGFVALAALVTAGAVLLRDTPFVWVLVVATCVWWLVVLKWIARYPEGFDDARPPRWLKAGAGLVVVPATIGAVAVLHGSPDGPLRLLFALVLVWAADVGAYFAGKALGRHKLAPNVSPGKTWEGVFGGLTLALVIAGVAGQWLFGLQGTAWLPFLLLCAAVVLLSIVGDLGESLLKRQAGVKDSGTLLPGHGGVLDRVDSLLAALPAMALGLRWLEL